MSASQVSLLGLSNEIVAAICGYLPNSDVKNLRLSCLQLAASARLHLGRIYLSANPRNVEVFNAIAGHEIFRHQVIEIVWDDTMLIEDATKDGDEGKFYDSEDEYELSSDDDDDPPIHYDSSNGRSPLWFSWLCKEAMTETELSNNNDPHTLEWAAEPIPRISECWAYYQELLEQQRQTIKSGAHILALEDAWQLRRFPGLRTITVTPSVHGRQFHPLYMTPMIRAFPPGFNYPVPQGWPTPKSAAAYYAPAKHPTNKLGMWDDDSSDWPGFRLITSMLARYPHDLAELRIDVFQTQSGINARFLERPCRALTDFTTLALRPSFRHLHLDLMLGKKRQKGLAAITCGRLATVLSAAKLRSLGIHTDLRFFDNVPLDERRRCKVSLRTIFTPASLAHVRHFSLGGFCVGEDDLFRLLASLPRSTLQTVKLNYLWLVPDDNNSNHNCGFATLLRRIRDELRWENVKLNFGQMIREPVDGQTIWVQSDTMDEFLYGGLTNPFVEPFEDEFYGEDPDQGVLVNGSIRESFGVLKDVFDESFERINMMAPEMSDEIFYRRTELIPRYRFH